MRLVCGVSCASLGSSLRPPVLANDMPGCPARAEEGAQKCWHKKLPKPKENHQKHGENHTWTLLAGVPNPQWMVIQVAFCNPLGFKHHPSEVAGTWYHLNISQPSFSSECFRAWLCQARQNAQATSLDRAHVLSLGGMLYAAYPILHARHIRNSCCHFRIAHILHAWTKSCIVADKSMFFLFHRCTSLDDGMLNPKHVCQSGSQRHGC